jgi:hypothetical protein
MSNELTDDNDIKWVCGHIIERGQWAGKPCTRMWADHWSAHKHNPIWWDGSTTIGSFQTGRIIMHRDPGYWQRLEIARLVR